MPSILVRDIPEELLDWLRAQAKASHRSTNKHVVALLDATRKGGATALMPVARAETLRALHARVASVQARIAATPAAQPMPSDDDTLGYDETGVPK